MTIATEQGILGQDFLHGYASAAYQVEGGYDKGGRGLSVWDEALAGKDNGNDGCASFERWREDVDLLRSYGANTYRFSISWSRVIPLGGRDDPVNQAGLDYYSTLVRCTYKRKADSRSTLCSRQRSPPWSHYFTGMYQPVSTSGTGASCRERKRRNYTSTMSTMPESVLRRLETESNIGSLIMR
jgi:hypothetical protein